MLFVQEKGHIKCNCPENKKRNAENKDCLSKSTNLVQEDSESGDDDMLSVSSGPDHLTNSWILD